MFLVNKRGSQQLKRRDLLQRLALRPRQQILNNSRMTRHGRCQQRRHLIRIGRHLRTMRQQQLHYLQTTALGAIVQGRIALHTLAIQVGAFHDQIFGNGEMALVAGDHETRVTVTIGDLDVRIVLDEEFHNFDVTIETSGPQCSRVRFGCRVDVSAFANEVFDDFEVASGASAPQWRRTFDILALEVNKARLLQIGGTIFDKVLDYFEETISTCF